MFNRALSDSEIASIYNAGSAGMVKTSTAPSITTQPQSQTVTVGNTVTFTVTATGTAPLSYQWRKDGVSLSDGGRISGVGTATLRIVNLQVGDAGAFTAWVSNGAGQVLSSEAVLVPQQA